MSLYSNPEGLVGYNELSPYLQMLLKKGSGTGGGVYIERSYLILTETEESVSVNLNTFNPSSDELLVFKNGLFMTLGLEYKFNISTKSISPINGEIWDGTESKPIIFDFISIEKRSNGNSSIDFIKINILSSEWIEEDGMYYKEVLHNLNSDSLILTAYDSDSKKSLQEIYTIIDENTLKLYNDSKINLSLTVINVSSSGNSSGTQSSSNSTTMEIEYFDYVSDLNMYKVNVVHNLDGEDLLIGAIDISTKKSVHIAYDIIDSNNIIVYNTNDSPLKLSILSI